MRKPTLKDLPEELQRTLLAAIPKLRGREPDTLVRALRPRDGFFHKSDQLRDERKDTLVFSTVPWELDTPSGAIRFQPYEPILLEPQPTRRTLLKVVAGAAAVALIGFPFITGKQVVQAQGLLTRFASAQTFRDRAVILNSIQGQQTQEARDLYVRILVTNWQSPTEAQKLVKESLVGLQNSGDQWYYTLACYYTLYARPEWDLKVEAIYRLAAIKDSLITQNLPHLKQADPKIYQECVRLLSK